MLNYELRLKIVTRCVCSFKKGSPPDELDEQGSQEFN